MTTAQVPGPHVGDELALRSRLPPPERCRAIREELDLPRAALARDLFITQETLYQWETGRATPQRGNLARYVALLERLQAEIDSRGEG
jgi:DNA-binding transcriptional regulator YiaG